MSLSAYTVFNTVVEQKSLIRAAEVLNITPSAVSHSLNSLEKQFGFTLLKRDRNGVMITSGGAGLLEHVRNVLDSEAKLQEEVHLLNGLEKGTVTVGAFNSVCINWLPDIIKSFNQHHPNIAIQVYQGGYRDVEIKVANGSLDLGFVSYPTYENVCATELLRDRMLCITPPNFRPSNENYVTIDDIRNVDFLLPRNSYDRITTEFLKKYNLEANLRHDISTDSAAIALVESGMGVSIIPELVLKRERGDFTTYSFRDFESRAIAIATMKNNTLSPTAKRFMAHVKEYVQQLDH